MLLQVGDREKTRIVDDASLVGEKLRQILPLLMIEIKQCLEFFVQLLFHIEISLIRGPLSNIQLH